MPRERHSKPLLLTDDERRTLDQWARRPTSAQRLALRSRIVLACAEQTFGLQSHRLDTFKLSADPQFVEKVRDIVGLYLNPPDHAIVICLDEKSQVQALDRTRPLPPMRPGIPARQTHDYIRHGTTLLFAELNVATGKVIGRCHHRHRHQELLKFLSQVDATLPPEGELAQSSGALLCEDHDAADSPGHLRECPRARVGDRPLPGAS